MTLSRFTGMIGGQPIGLPVVGSGFLTTNIVVGGAVAASITGVAAVGGVGTVTVSASSNKTLTGVAAVGGVGSLVSQNTHTLTGNIAAASPGTFAPQLTRYMFLVGAGAGAHPGLFAHTNTHALLGAHAPGAAGPFTAIAHGGGFRMDALLVSVQPASDLSRDVSMRWSDSKGEAWGNPILQTLGDEGEFLTNLQWRRLGMGRDRVFEVSWTTPCETSIVGAFIQYDTSET